jgi:hypothetical protein
VITGRKITEDASFGGILGREKTQCLRTEFKMRNWQSQLERGHGKRRLTCHANGTFLRFASTSATARIPEELPGPVKVLNRRFLRFTRDAPTTKRSVAVNNTDFRGIRAAEAILTISKTD